MTLVHRSRYFVSLLLRPLAGAKYCNQFVRCEIHTGRQIYHTGCFFSQANDWIATKLPHDGLQVSLHPRCAQGQGQGQRSRDTGTFVLSRKSLLLAGKWTDRDETCIRWFPEEFTSRICSSSTSRCKVMWYQHIWNFTKNCWPSLSQPLLFQTVGVYAGDMELVLSPSFRTC